MKKEGKTIEITAWVRGPDGDSEYDYDYRITVRPGETAETAARRLGILGKIEVR